MTSCFFFSKNGIRVKRAGKELLHHELIPEDYCDFSNCLHYFFLLLKLRDFIRHGIKAV